MIEKYAWKDRGVEKNHNFLLPRNIRAIIVGSSGAGKTCLTTSLLLQPEMLDYENLTVCGRSLQDQVAGDGVEFTDFRDFCAEVWSSGKHCFVVIDKTRPSHCGKFRRNLDEFWVPP